MKGSSESAQVPVPWPGSNCASPSRGERVSSGCYKHVLSAGANSLSFSAIHNSKIGHNPVNPGIRLDLPPAPYNHHVRCHWQPWLRRPCQHPQTRRAGPPQWHGDQAAELQGEWSPQKLWSKGAKQESYNQAKLLQWLNAPSIRCAADADGANLRSATRSAWARSGCALTSHPAARRTTIALFSL